MQRMENDWATQALARQYMKNRRSRAYLKGTLERPEGYDHLKNNAARRSISGSRVKKAKVVLEARLAKRALEDNEDRTADRPRKKARAPTPNSQPEFVQGSSRDGRDQVGNPWDAHPQIDDDFVPEDEEDFSGAERDEMDRDRFADDSEPGSE